MRRYSVLFMAANYWLIYTDDGGDNWYFQTGTSSLDRAHVALIAESLNEKVARA